MRASFSLPSTRHLLPVSLILQAFLLVLLHLCRITLCLIDPDDVIIDLRIPGINGQRPFVILDGQRVIVLIVINGAEIAQCPTVIRIVGDHFFEVLPGRGLRHSTQQVAER